MCGRFNIQASIVTDLARSKPNSLIQANGKIVMKKLQRIKNTKQSVVAQSCSETDYRAMACGTY